MLDAVVVIIFSVTPAPGQLLGLLRSGVGPHQGCNVLHSMDPAQPQ